MSSPTPPGEARDLEHVLAVTDPLIVGAFVALLVGLLGLFGWSLRQVLKVTSSTDQLATTVSRVVKEQEDHETRLRVLERPRARAR